MKMLVEPADIYLYMNVVDFRKSIKQAPVPHSVIPKGYATPSLLSQIVTSKYQYGLPLYRQEAMLSNV